MNLHRYDPNNVPKSLPTTIDQPPATKHPTLACEGCKVVRMLAEGKPPAIAIARHTYVGRYAVKTETEAPTLMFYQFIYECSECGNRRVFGTESV